MTPEFSRCFRLDTLGPGARSETIAATPDECAGLAKRFGLILVGSLSAQAQLIKKQDGFVATGTYRADAIQACVVTGDPLPVHVSEPFTVRFVAVDAPIEAAELELDAADCDVMDHDGNMIDLGEAVAQSLGLALDPFPRGPNAQRRLREAGVLAEGEAGPFGVLKGLRDKMGDA
jgi:uncharacterized metal-binding protein YceD (DUF177 family)